MQTILKMAILSMNFAVFSTYADITVDVYSVASTETNMKAVNPELKSASAPDANDTQLSIETNKLNEPKKTDKPTTDNQKKILMGTITFKTTQYGLMMTPDLHDLSPGMHGMHLHEHASCDHHAKEAGGHFDPNNTGAHNGPYNNQGHLGDLPALYVNADGVANHPILAPRLQESDLYGHAIVIHAGSDNYADSPAALGGGGERIACGVIKPIH